ncbi:glycogen/starch/alpha-glucan phosphorylase, partial [Gammaproteobacteria bacterium]|nr:glycogen/starch/alpha-glucan phosphorylase [Gammaproteobacteria bacterium]
MTKEQLSQALTRHLKYSLGKDPQHAALYDWRMALSLAVRDLIVEPWFESTRRAYQEQHKRVYYLSMEFLIGRLLEDAVVNLGLRETAESVLSEHGVSLEALVNDEPDAALGNGGLGRLAACFLDSLTTIGVPAIGYGIRYDHGLFKQHFEDGEQMESPEDWLEHGSAWQFDRPEAAYIISFGGHVDRVDDKPIWRPGETVKASCYDTPIVGWQGRWANTLRLWSSQPTEALRLEDFNRGDYTAAAKPEALARAISRVLYPDDTTP